MEGDFYGEAPGDPGAGEHYFEPQTQNEDYYDETVAGLVGQETGHEPSESGIDTPAEHTSSTLNFNRSTGRPEADTGISLPGDPHLVDPIPSSQELAERASITGTVAVVGLTAVGLAARGVKRRSARRSLPSKPPAN
jgi:hypothetical protein